MARQMIAGFKERPQDFPSPFVSGEQMERELADAEAGLLRCDQTEAAAKAATADKERRFKQLTKTMAVNLRYSELQARKNPLLLLAVGWRLRRNGH